MHQSLHSRYNPLGEAERYLDSLDLHGDFRFFILIEPGIGYLLSPLRQRYPSSKIISIHAKDMPEMISRPDSFWYPGSKKSLRDFLEQEIPETEAALIKVIEWRPAMAVYKEAYRFLLSETVEFLKQTDASARTMKQFGQKWFKNFFKNLIFFSKILIPAPFSFPLLITGAGPSLEETIPLIQKERSNLLLLAVSSSVSALKACGLEPDIIISSDGGNWALLHLYECIRENEDIKLAVSLNAALPSQCKNSSFLLVSDGSLWQELILQRLEIPFISLPQRGTVSAAALDLAFALSDSMVFLTGVDLSHKDIQTHARPYSFDRIWEEKAGRFSPVYSQVFLRSLLIRTGGSNDIYASWFSRQLAAYPKQLHSLGPNNPVFQELETRSLKTQESGLKKPVWKTMRIKQNKHLIKEIVYFLIGALKNPLYNTRLMEELRALIIPGNAQASMEELTERIIFLTRPFWELMSSE